MSTHAIQADNIVRFIERYQEEWGFPPSRREIAAEIGVNVSTTQNHLDKMVREGLLKRAPGIPRGIRVIGAAMKQTEETV